MHTEELQPSDSLSRPTPRAGAVSAEWAVGAAMAEEPDMDRYWLASIVVCKSFFRGGLQRGQRPQIAPVTHERPQKYLKI